MLELLTTSDWNVVATITETLKCFHHLPRKRNSNVSNSWKLAKWRINLFGILWLALSDLCLHGLYMCFRFIDLSKRLVCLTQSEDNIIVKSKQNQRNWFCVAGYAQVLKQTKVYSEYYCQVLLCFKYYFLNIAPNCRTRITVKKLMKYFWYVVWK